MLSSEFASATGRATTLQVMVKDVTRYPESGGWGFGRFVDGKPVDEVQHQTCSACHEERVRERDFAVHPLRPSAIATPGWPDDRLEQAADALTAPCTTEPRRRAAASPRSSGG